MGNRVNNFPNAKAPQVEPGEIGELVEKMEELRNLPYPQSDEAFEQRITWFFRWCIENDVKPGVELLSLALGISRVTLWKWEKQEGRKGRAISKAKQLMAALLESWGMNGQINPTVMIFLQKNHFGYRDSVEIQTEPVNQFESLPDKADIMRRLPAPPDEEPEIDL